MSKRLSPNFVYGTAKTPQSENELYETPEEATTALLDAVRLSECVWEPSCGKGAIVRVLRKYGYRVFGSDLNYGIKKRDFLKSKYLGGDIVTNPPFSLTLEFAQHGVQLLKGSKRKLALFLRLDFLASKGRKAFLQSSPLKEVLVFSSRIGFITPNSQTKADGSKKPRKAINYAWFVWEDGYKGNPTIRWIN